MQHMVTCPACDGTGGGNGSIRGPLGGRLEGVCPECRGNGDVTEAKRERLLERAAGAAAQAKLAAIVAYCKEQADAHNREFGMGVWPQDMKVSARDILVIAGVISEEER